MYESIVALINDDMFSLGFKFARFYVPYLGECCVYRCIMAESSVLIDTSNTSHNVT